ncbi:hypothetical protein F4777DRAFT_106383 [Nemania sp. FL0916]|nr:hypothetical protein F4777DRAFT_106383 [Nemania sp. FL0916]
MPALGTATAYGILGGALAGPSACCHWASSQSACVCTLGEMAFYIYMYCAVGMGRYMVYGWMVVQEYRRPITSAGRLGNSIGYCQSGELLIA